MLAASVLLALSIGQLRAQSILRTGPVEPLTYEQKEGRLKVLEGVVLDSTVDVSISPSPPMRKAGRTDMLLPWRRTILWPFVSRKTKRAPLREPTHIWIFPILS